MRLLLDQGLPRGAVVPLGLAGHEAVHVGDIRLAFASDADILDEAVRRGATVVTLDADFHALLALSRATKPSVIRLRVEGLRADALSQLIVAVISVSETDLVAGAVVTADATRARVRRLPIVAAR